MKRISKSIMTAIFIFGAAFILAASGCADSSGGGSKNPKTPQADVEDLKPLKAEDVRECSKDEFAQLISWRNTLNRSNALIDKMGDNQSGWKQEKATVDASLAAINACDSRFRYHKSAPCKKTKATIVSTEVKVYDAFRLKRDCSKPDAYLKKFNLRPDPNATDSLPYPANPQPLPTNPGPSPSVPVQPLPDNSSGSLNTCSNDEFSKLNQWSAQLDKANTAIGKLGSISQWKYDSNSITTATVAAKSCESLIKYHSSQPCEKNAKSYTGEAIATRCQTARTYFYEFAQRTNSLNSAGADLYVDLSNYNQRVFEAGAKISTDNCVFENNTDNIIDYSNRKALVKDSRGFVTDDSEMMMVFETEEGLLIQCYGLEVNGPFSKNQIMHLLKAKNTNIRLEYQLK